MKKDMKNAVIGGVCAGMAKYFGLKPFFIRLLFIIFLLMGGSSILIYAILALILPVEE